MSEIRPQVEPDHYLQEAYASKERWCSMWHQIDEVMRGDAGEVLEIGPGAGSVTAELRRRGRTVTTLDIDDRLDPDVVGSVTALPFADNAFSVVLCAEVLEHLPFEDVVPALRELARVARSRVVLSVPDDRPWMGVALPLYFSLYVQRLRDTLPPGNVRHRLTPFARAARGHMRWRDAAFLSLLPMRWATGGTTIESSTPPIPHQPWEHAFDGEHYWELGTVGYPVERFVGALRAGGLALQRDFRVPEMPWHHFFVAAPR